MRAKIFVLLFSLISIAGYSQTINGRLYTQFNNYYKWRGGAFDSTLLLPNVTATAGLRPGAIRYNGADSSVYVWSGNQWNIIAGGGGSSYTFTNGLTESGGVVKLGGTLTENTIISGNGYNYYISGANIGLFDATSLQIRSTGRSVVTLNDALRLFPHLGQITIDSLVASSNLTNKQFTVLDTTTGALSRYTGSVLTAVPTLQEVTGAGNSTTDSVNVIASNGDRIVSLFKENLGNDVGFLQLGVEGGVFRSRYFNNGFSFSNGTFQTGIGFGNITRDNSISFADSSGVTALGVRVNGTTYMAGSNGIADLGNVVDSIYRKAGKDSIFYRRGGTEFAIKDSVGSGGSGGIQWAGSDSLFAYTRYQNGYHELEDFIGYGALTVVGANVPGSKFGVAWSNGNNSGTQISGIHGSMTLTTATSATGSAGVGHFAAAAQAYTFEATADWTVLNARVRIPNLNDGTDRYFIFIGFSDASGTGWYNPTALTNGIGFYYDLSGSVTSSASTANWQTATASASNRTFNQNYTPTAVAENTWTLLTIKYTSSTVQFFVNGSLVATHVNNIPTAFLTPHLVIRKTNSTTARTMNVDFISIDKKMSR